MSIKNLTVLNDADLFCRSLEADTIDAKTLGAGDLIVDTLLTRNDDQTLTRLNQPNYGTSGQVLKSVGDGRVEWKDEGQVIPVVVPVDHINPYLYVGTNPATGGAFLNQDYKHIFKKYGRWRDISGEIKAEVGLNGYSVFAFRFDNPFTDDVGTGVNYNIYLNGAMAYSATSQLFLPISASYDSINRTFTISFITIDKLVWPQNQLHIVRVYYSLSYVALND